MRIVFIYNEGRIARLEKVREGLAATEFYYGAIQLQERGYEVEFYEVDDWPRPSIGQKIADFFFKCHLLPTRVSGSLLMQVLNICGKLDNPDIIVGTSTSIAFALGTAKALGLVKAEIVALCMTLIYHKHSWLRSRVNGYLLRRMWTQLLGESELEGIKKIFKVPDSHVTVNYFGVDKNFWSPGEEEEDYVLSVGNDSRRDYEILLRAAAKVDIPFRIVTTMEISGVLPDNVKIIHGTRPSDESIDDKLKSWYQKSKCVVLPIKDTIRPSGQSVCLQAMSCGKTVILTKTQGLWSKSMLQDGENIIFVPPNDAEALAQAIKNVLENSVKRKAIGIKARETICHEGNIDKFSYSLEGLIKKISYA